MKLIKIPGFSKRKKILAATARRASAASAGIEFDGIPEPNMKLSRALLIVLLLHVVAVSGIIAFNAIKTRERSFVPPASTGTEKKPTQTAATANQTVSEKSRTATVENENAKHTDAKPSHPPPVKEEAAKKVLSSGKTYVVKKGDNPATIAKKLKVSYSDLVALNHIEDPRKLHIGQKLLVPEAVIAKTKSAKTTNQKKNKQ